ncbi:uncharacterized protein LOC130673135 [Microplitis mediator]|uniref:uncharacterized protein LOC130673135 n=1 Tax=Microplitis mediator TaxID=375433 RepID=UPI002553D75C|nr:uncharacterized protein LOC130673135 [Microplitis mediator]
MAARIQALLDTFTVDDEITNWVPNDNTVELIGFVDKIEGTKRVPVSKGSTLTTPLYKIIVSNGSSSKVRVLFWGPMAIDYSAKIRDRTIIKISRRKTAPGNISFNNPYECIGPLELTLNNSSTIEIMKELFDEVVDDSPVETVSLINAPNYKKKMYVLGWLKLPFNPVTSYGSTYGSGVIINGNNRLKVQIANYVENPKMTKGVYRKVLCESSVDSKGISFLIVHNSTDITLEEGQVVMTEAALRKTGFITPKRSSEDDQGGVPERQFAPFA